MSYYNYIILIFDIAISSLITTIIVKIATAYGIIAGRSMKPGIWGPECWLQETLNAPPTGNNTRTLPPGCGKTEFLLKIKGAFVNQSEFVDGSYGSKAIFI